MQFIRVAGPSLVALVVLFQADRAQAQHLRLGAIAGVPVTRDYPAQYFPEMRTELPDGTVLVRPAFSVLPGPRSLIGGATLEWELDSRFSVEGNAIYRRLRTQGDPPVPTVTWEFPVLAKYRFTGGAASPFLEAGPSFRSTGNRNTEPSHLGVSVGAGFDWQWKGLRFAPTVRYTRWRADGPGTDPSKQDQIEALFAVSRGGLRNRNPFGRRVRFGVTAGRMLVRPVWNDSFSGELSRPSTPRVQPSSPLEQADEHGLSDRGSNSYSRTAGSSQPRPTTGKSGFAPFSSTVSPASLLSGTS
ncbi:MAG: hypothetical protein R2724_32940 [Bryobacterales bacterium]